MFQQIALDMTADIVNAVQHERAIGNRAEISALDLVDSLVNLVAVKRREQLARCEHHDLFAVKVAQRDARDLVGEMGDREVDVSLDDHAPQHVVGAFDQLDADGWKRLLESEDGVGQYGAPAGVGNADAQHAALVLGDIAELLLHGGVFLAKHLGVAQQHFARIGELEGNVPHDELAAELLFHLGDIGAERLLRDVELL